MVTIDPVKCQQCGGCVKDCFIGALSWQEKKIVYHEGACINCGHCLAICPNDAVQMPDYDRKDVKELGDFMHEIDGDTLLGFIQARRTIRKFQEKSVEQEKLLKILEAGRFTASGSNRQPNSYIVVQNDLPQLKEMMLEALVSYGEQVLKTNADRLMKKYALLWKKMQQDYQQQGIDRLLFQAPTAIFIVSDVPRDAALAAGNMELLVYAQGLGMLYSGFCTMAARQEKVKSFLQIPAGKEVEMCLVMGYPAVTYHRTVPRKALDVVFR